MEFLANVIKEPMSLDVGFLVLLGDFCSIGGVLCAIAAYCTAGVIASYILSSLMYRKFKNSKYDYEDILIHKRISPILAVLFVQPVEMLILYLGLLLELVSPLFATPVKAIKSFGSVVFQLLAWPATLPVSLYKMYDNEVIEMIVNEIKRKNSREKSVNVSSIIEIFGPQKRRLLVALRVASLDQLFRGELEFVAGSHEMAASLIEETRKYMEER